jgi:hypothetical protein
VVKSVKAKHRPEPLVRRKLLTSLEEARMGLMYPARLPQYKQQQDALSLISRVSAPVEADVIAILAAIRFRPDLRERALEILKSFMDHRTDTAPRVEMTSRIALIIWKEKFAYPRAVRLDAFRVLSEIALSDEDEEISGCLLNAFIWDAENGSAIVPAVIGILGKHVKTASPESIIKIIWRTSKILLEVFETTRIESINRLFEILSAVNHQDREVRNVLLSCLALVHKDAMEVIAIEAEKVLSEVQRWEK